jgi:streptomycin 3"-adenylyltransferase
MEYKFPKDAPESVREFLAETLSILHPILSDDLVGVYLYGSLAMGCFNPESSDVDIILVVRKSLSVEKRRKIISHLKRACSEKKRLELNIVDMDVLRKPTYPIMVNLHYEYWGNTLENEMDSEILSNLYTARKRGFRVWGNPIYAVFSKIPSKYHLRSVIEDIQRTREHLHENQEYAGYNVPVYWVLGSCRILAFIREGRVLSKAEGGQWGLTNLRKKYHSLIQQALACCLGKKNNRIWSREELDAFADYMTNTLLRESREKDRILSTHTQPTLNQTRPQSDEVKA